MLIYEDQLVLMPLMTQTDDIDDLGAALPAPPPLVGAAAGASADGGSVPTGDGSPSVDAAAAAVRQAADHFTDLFVRRPYIVPLANMASGLTGTTGLQGDVQDMTFLHCYFQPTLAILQVRLAAHWS